MLLALGNHELPEPRKGQNVRVRNVIRNLSVGLLILLGTIAVGPLAGKAQQAATTPLAQTTESTGEGNTTPIVGTPQLQPAIDLARAQDIALQGQSGAVVTDVELDGEDGRLTYTVGLDNGSDIQLDAMSGEVIKTEQEQADDGQKDEQGNNSETSAKGDEQENGDANNHEEYGNDDEESGGAEQG